MKKYHPNDRVTWQGSPGTIKAAKGPAELLYVINLDNGHTVEVWESELIAEESALVDNDSDS